MDDKSFWFSVAASLLAIFISGFVFYIFLRKKERSVNNVVLKDPVSFPSREVPGHDYEVFLSFRGKDTRKGFTDYLYKGLVNARIWVFRDDDELPVGEKIGPELLEAIKKSKISILILSEDYASSKWCLNELVQILDCKKTQGQVVLPIFYKVEPSDVRNLTGCFGKAFGVHKKKVDEKVVEEWREVLREVGSLQGWESEKTADGHEGRLVELVVSKVLRELKKAFLVVTEHLVGVDEHVERIMEKVDANFNDVQVIGIHGMGGVGKTTLAKIIFNELSNHIEHCCFLPDIRETSLLPKGIERLQSQLISNILKRESEDISNVDEGTAIIGKRFRGKKVLILLDDVDDEIQLNALAGSSDWFGLGSRIIITTRNKDVLNVHEVDFTYELTEMNADQSLLLFSRHAFRRDFPPNEYATLSRDVIETTGGLPLALEVIGSFLYGKRKTVWQGTLKKLRKIPDHKVREKLRISYEALDHGEKQIFLDIACLFIEMNRINATYMWDDCSYFPEKSIENLILMSLIKIGEKNELRMHDQLRDLGREVVREENYIDPGKRSRLWIHKEAAEVLERKQGTQKVEALLCDFIDIQEGYNFTDENFANLKMLRFLQVNHVDLAGDFKYLLLELRWLRWKGCLSSFKPTNFHLKNLVILDLSNSCITVHWKGWNEIEMTKKLKVLNLTSCNRLVTTPDLSTFSKLEILILEKCENLEEIGPSIGDIESLITLNIRNCCKLKFLPDKVGKLKELRQLLIDGTAIQEIPANISSMKKLEILSAADCQSLVQIPNSIGDLTSLMELNFWNCTKLAELPDSIGSLVRLGNLSLWGCRSLNGIPESLGKLELLTELELSCTKTVDLPDAIRNLCNLKVLRMENSYITRLPSAIGMLHKLEKMDATNCVFLEGEVPDELGELSSLQFLRLDRTGICCLPKSISKLSKLETLDVWNSQKLKSLPELPTGLTTLRFTGTSMEEFPDTSKLTNLKYLSVSDFFEEDNKALYLGNLSKLETLVIFESNIFPLDLGKLSRLRMLSLYKVEIGSLPTEVFGLSQLKELDIHRCQKLENLPELPSSLVRLHVRTCLMLKTLPNLSNLKLLSSVKLNECAELMELKGLAGLESLTVLGISGCKKLSNLDGVENLKSLRELLMAWCEALEWLPDLSNLKQLKELFAPSCKNLSEIQGLDEMENLQHLHLSGCTSLETLGDLSYLKRLKDLNIKNCEKLCGVEGLDELTSLTKLDVSGCKSFLIFPDLSKLGNLEELRVQGYDELLEIPGLEKLKLLKYLDISECKLLKRLPDISKLTNLQQLILQDCENLVDLQGIESLKFLRYLDISGCKSLENVPVLSSATYVEHC